ncbi:B3 domain-containing transcription factor VRN1-like [Vicia villosa]|uniref:B3 domain-containing transcription factor VRN1-like n=1 Tax=Vicia villosa TaxID=3911 RepID=UPI00273C31B0|nr:B3 domain-containing transcription factor VRN1-like [Vicia villosa]
MARANATLPISFFKIILQTNLQTIKIPNKFTKIHGASLPNPVMMKPPDGTKWKVFWKNINGEIWFQKGWSIFTKNYSLQHGCLVVFKYKEGSSELDVIILGQNAVEIDYGFSCNTLDETENLGHSDDESVEILNDDDESFEILKDKKARQKSPLVSPRPHKKVRGEIKETSGKNTSLNCPRGKRAQEVAAKFISSNPFFTILIKPNHLRDYRMSVPNLKGIIEDKEKYLILKNEKMLWNVKLLCSKKNSNERFLSAGWSLFARETGLQSGDVCVFELMNKEDLVFKVHVF